MEHDVKVKRISFFLTDIFAGMLLFTALTASAVWLDLCELLGLAAMCAALALPILVPFICGKLTKRSFLSSLAFINMGMLAAFMLSNKLSELMVYFNIIPDNFIRGLYEKNYPGLEPEFISQEMHGFSTIVLFLLIESALLFLTAFTVKVVMRIRQINKQFNAYYKSGT